VSSILLPIFRNTPETETEERVYNNELESYKKQLWTAPELLRMKTCPLYGTQKGDVYSYAIVVQEIAYRADPFFSEDISAKGHFK